MKTIILFLLLLNTVGFKNNLINLTKSNKNMTINTPSKIPVKIKPAKPMEEIINITN